MLVEAVVLLPIFLLVFAGIEFGREVYLAKMQLMKDVRHSVWRDSLHGCTGPTKGERTGGDDFTSEVGQGGSAGSSTLDDYGSHEGLKRSSNKTGRTLTKTVARMPLIQRSEIKQQAKLQLICNEEPKNANILELVKMAFDRRP